jgi:hypothetical protein
LTKIEENDRQEGVAIAPSTAGLAYRPEQPEGECREEYDMQVENGLRVEAEEGVARDKNEPHYRPPVSLDILPEPGEINPLGAGHEGDEQPVLPARSAVAVTATNPSDTTVRVSHVPSTNQPDAGSSVRPTGSSAGLSLA